ncbi:class I SAM-dependent methyltransferase [Algimonas porphyrae]|uniref:ATP synthase subunit beta n=1 Tax=Algimonas porphyrae TaxID=1128113 RepID=A0ABQ5UZY8_9PROT|nr:SAM-dependent methyltransferase [Algimonas porphyrae]GLQ20138.1 ATP synthase subunit beta [Algimonas porphyrae]
MADRQGATPLSARIKAQIADTGPINVAEYMTLCLLDPVDGYYPTRDPLGSDGDFITAPEISQMFGECLGLWIVQSWQDLGRPKRFNLVELGPGRGVMMSDMLKAVALEPACRKAVQVTLVEASAALQAVQARSLADRGVTVSWTDRLEAVDDAPCLIIGNEFLDCLPIRQFVYTQQNWSERRIGVQDGQLRFETDGQSAPESVTNSFPGTHPTAVDGDLLEICPASAQIVDHLAARFTETPGRALFIDYGPETTEYGDTLQALKRHEKVGVFSAPGDTDLTARVDFSGLKALADAADLQAHGPVTQRALLSRLGIELRAVALLRGHEDARPKLLRQLHRLTDDEEMGSLFKAVCLSAPGLPDPLGFT